MRAGIIRALAAYTAIWRKGCTPPDSTSWTNLDNNKAFVAQTVVMTPNPTLSIPGALRTASPDDYYKNAATVDWPLGVNGQPLVIGGFIHRAVVFKAGRSPAISWGCRGAAAPFFRLIDGAASCEIVPLDRP
jgi:multiple sugar transport system substrate-binding protein